MATWHRAADPVLNSDLESLAATQGHVLRVTAAPEAARMMRQAVAAAAAPVAAAAEGGRGKGPIVTVLFPHDISWQTVAAAAAAAGDGDADGGTAGGVEGSRSREGTREDSGSTNEAELASSPGALAFIRGCAEALKEAGARGKAALLLGGAATLDDGVCVFRFGLTCAVFNGLDSLVRD